MPLNFIYIIFIMIRIYYCNSASDAIPEEISDYRREKILSASNLSQRQRMINTARALKAGFAELGINENDVIYGFQKNGKPYAQNFPEVYFSISHTDNLSIVAFYDREIGIDCENSQRDISTDILNRYFSKEEVTAFSDSAITLWVTKEAFVKYTGKGFAAGRNEIKIPYFEDELKLDGLWFKKLSIDGHTVVICSDKSDEIVIKKAL